MMTEFDWTAQRVLVTAGASGIGREIAAQFHATGAQVSICDLDEAGLERAAAEMPGLRAARCDVADPAACDSVVAQAAEAMGGLDILINNAGIAGPAAPVQDIADADWQRTFAVNVHGQFHMARAAIPHIRRAGAGSILCMASVAGKFAFPLRAPYAASKAAVIALARSLSVELGPDGIRVNAIAPGVVAGDRIRRVFADRARSRGIPEEEMERAALRAVSLGRMVEAEEIAGMVLFLCAPSGRSITGQVISICGGLEYTE